MSDCLKSFLLGEIPFSVLFLCLAHFGGGIHGWEFLILLAVVAVCAVAEYPFYKRIYWRSKEK